MFMSLTSHVPYLRLADMEQLLHVPFLVRIRFLYPEYPAQIVCLDVAVSLVDLVFKHEIHLGVVYEGFAQMYSFLFE